jgi:glycosyltransferase involved in cell wall biosynthesis
LVKSTLPIWSLDAVKIAHICRALLRRAGTERFILETTYEMSKRGIDTRIYTTAVNGDLAADVSRFVKVERTALIAVPLLHLYSELAISKRLVGLASSWADVVILHHGIGVAGSSSRQHDMLCVPFFHIDKYDASLYDGLDWFAPAYTYPLKVLETNSVRSVPIAFVNSRSLNERVRQYTNATNVITIPLGVDIDRFSPTWVDNEFILMVGRYNPANNFELGLAAASKTRYKVIVAGIHEPRFDWYFRHLQQWVSKSPELRDRVDFLNPNDHDLIPLIQNCSMFLSPRKYGYLGLAALEAMACGKAVIASEVDEEISESQAVLVCGQDSDEWQKAVARLAKDRALRQAIGEESRAFVERGHTWKKTVDVMLDSIDRALNGRRATV